MRGILMLSGLMACMSIAALFVASWVAFGEIDWPAWVRFPLAVMAFFVFWGLSLASVGVLLGSFIDGVDTSKKKDGGE